MTKTLLVKNAAILVTMDERRREIYGGGLFAVGNEIISVAATGELPKTADEVLDLSGHVVVPGLVNTHHHMYQSLTRAVPTAQDGDLFAWLKALYPIWERLTPEMMYVSTQTAMAELLLSGCTTSSDHMYVYPNGCQLDDSIEAASGMGMRFHASRGAMSIGESKGGLPPDSLVESEVTILKDSQRLVDAYHDSGRFSMLRIALAPCSPFSVSEDLMRETAALARGCGVSLHTHLAENVADVAYSHERFGKTPAQYAETLGWIGPDVWHAHCVHLDDHGIALLARTGTGIAHCPSSNMRLGSGIAPVRRLLDANASVGLGVDGSASNDGADMLAETRQALLLQRVFLGPRALSARDALELATRGGARVLNRDDIGVLSPRKAADFAAFPLEQIGLAGALHDPVAALVLCSTVRAAYTVVNGRVLVRQGKLVNVDLKALLRRHNCLAAQLLNG